MQQPSQSRQSALPLWVAVLGSCAAFLAISCGGEAPASPAAASDARPPAPVEIAPVASGTVTLRRTFSGTVEASARVQIASRVTGQLESLSVDIGDEVKRDQPIGTIDDDDLEQAVLQAEADLAVARASKLEADSSVDFARRALERLEALDKDGVASKSELDTASTAARAREASVAVAAARVQRAEASLATARLRRKEARIVARWAPAEPLLEPEGTVLDDGALSSSGSPSGSPVGPETRLVAERFVDEGSLVTAGTPIVSVVALDPILAVVFVPERDYARLKVGQAASLVTDAYPGTTFDGMVARVAPVFSRSTRQVRVEIGIPNADLRLKPGMFVRATLELARDADATIVPYAALTDRGGGTGVFVVEPKPSGEQVVRWVSVIEGIREGDLIGVTSADGTSSIFGSVVTLGHELCDDGSTVIVPESSR